MVDGERLRARLDRLEHLLERLEEVRTGGEAAYLADARLRAAGERWLQLAIQVCIDTAAQVVAETSQPRRATTRASSGRSRTPGCSNARSRSA